MSVFIIAEAGVNHNGNIELARKMVDAAAAAGADAIKFQTFKAEKLVCRDAKKALYQMKTTKKEESQFEMLRKLELDQEAHRELIDYCKEKKLLFLSTPYDLESANMLLKIGMQIFKIPSGEITNLPYLRGIAALHKRVILSTGMSSMEEVTEAVRILKENGALSIDVLHCNTEYPTPMENVNLRSMLTMKRQLGISVGYSDHTQGIEVAIAATALGAEIIEKHFTLDRNMEGPDHKASLEPEELKSMVSAIRNIEKALGNGDKIPSCSELKNREAARKSIVAKKTISKGDFLTTENITVKRPGNGISPMKWDEVIGQKSNRDYKMDEMIEL